MPYQSNVLKCASCGFPVGVGDAFCPAGHPQTITSFNSVYDMPMPMLRKYSNACNKELNFNPENPGLNTSLGMCYLKLKQYDKALNCFERAIEENFDNSELCFYAAVALLRGRKAFVASRRDIDRIITLIEDANMIEPRGIYYYFLAYIKYDYFERRYLDTEPDYNECLDTAFEVGVSRADVKMLFDVLGVEQPNFE